MTRRIFITTAIFMASFCCALLANAHSEGERRFTLDNTRFVQMKSSQTGQAHELIIALPSSYHQSPDKKYPVLYFLDAYWDMPLVAATYGNLIYDNVVPEFIMVGFSYPGNVDYGKERRRDFTPTKVSPNLGADGGAPEFLRFIKESVVPMIEADYRGDKQHRALAGSSLGGLFALYAMYTEPAFFTSYIAISPAAVWDANYLAKMDSAYAKNHKELKARAFISYGTDEYKPFADPIAALQQQIKKRRYKGLELMNFKMDGLRHTAVKGDGYVRGLMWAWQDIAPTSPSGLENAMTGNN
jgi:predicted alpha/beta superfamily hydrolase